MCLNVAQPSLQLKVAPPPLPPPNPSSLELLLQTSLSHAAHHMSLAGRRSQDGGQPVFIKSMLACPSLFQYIKSIIFKKESTFQGDIFPAH